MKRKQYPRYFAAESLRKKLGRRDVSGVALRAGNYSGENRFSFINVPFVLGAGAVGPFDFGMPRKTPRTIATTATITIVVATAIATIFFFSILSFSIEQTPLSAAQNRIWRSRGAIGAEHFVT
jgi:hypothetical protein